MLTNILCTFGDVRKIDTVFIEIDVSYWKFKNDKKI